MKHITWCILILTLPAALHAAPINLPSQSMVEKHPELFTWILGIALIAALLLAGWFVWFHQQDTRKLWDRSDSHETKIQDHDTAFAALVAEHRLRGLLCPALRRMEGVRTRSSDGDEGTPT